MTSFEMLMPPPVFIDEGNAFRPVGAATPCIHRHQQPPYDYDWDAYTIVTWVLSIRDVLGGGTFTMTPTLWFAQESVLEPGGDSSQWRDRRGYQPDLNEVVLQGKTSLFGTISAAGTYSATVRLFPRSMWIDLSSLNVSGGTDTRLRMSLVGYPK